ncbi:uncharacterized protein LOC113279719 [Papaver somniferum]|uniref:uncharacterized protein LOC113279719 n=1 Tax=Papaver somniferum TaxID=3469 RepID=UPI000E6F914A|nr:uncharacterized protein LOC113279719 [Papaver somniferum]
MTPIIEKDWMDETDIFSKVYRDGVKYFIQFAATYGYSNKNCACPCARCQNKKNLKIAVVRQHLLEKGIDKSYRIWAHHGEKSTSDSSDFSGKDPLQEENHHEQNTEDAVPGMESFIDAANEVREGGPDGDVHIHDANLTQTTYKEPFEVREGGADGDIHIDDTNQTRMTYEEPFVPDRLETVKNSNVLSEIPASLKLQTNTSISRPKCFITVDVAGRPVGEHAEKLSTRIGELVRHHCPISYTDWRLVPETFKDDVWNALLREYEFNAPSQFVRPYLEKSFPAFYRRYKYDLRKQYIKDATNQEEVVAKCPIGCKLDVWKAFVANEFEEVAKEKRAKNVESKKKSTICHTLGRRSYVNKCYILEKEEGIVLDGRPDVWMKGHEKSDGTVHPSAVEKYEQLKAANEKRKRLDEGGSGKQLNFDSDAVAEVFGPDGSNSHLRAYSSCVSKKRALQACLATSLMESEVSKVDAPIAAMVANLSSRVEGLFKIVAEILSRPPTAEETTPTFDAEVSAEETLPTFDAEVAAEETTPTFDAEVRDNVNYCYRGIGKQNVNLLNREGKIVSTGYTVVGKEGEMCHGRKVQPGEKMVRIETVVDVFAPVPDPPQGGYHYTLQGFVDGGCVIWFESRLRPR